jgi:hypothetical protein
VDDDLTALHRHSMLDLLKPYVFHAHFIGALYASHQYLVAGSVLILLISPNYTCTPNSNRLMNSPITMGYGNDSFILG